ncbi:MAG TPA: TetR/AcrR family transcriptional regulator [Blastocatellia bacterium]|jgi:AcrR family transcriptional regulator|nr:TetR/AcrR family transcriptional regulator [Blastocatellia bacterium]
MGSKERRERQKESLRQEILDAARDLFVNEGYENVSMRRIAEKIEYSPTTIYLYFQDKSELLFNICEETFARLSSRLEEITRGDEPIQCLKKGLNAYVEFGLQYPNHYRVTFINHPTHGIDKERYMHEGSMGMNAYSHLRLGVERCVQAGLFRVTDIDLISQSMWAAVHGVTAILITKPHFPWVDKEKMISLVIDNIIEGLMA